MVDDNELDMLRNIPAPAPSADAKARALAAAMAAYDLEKNPAATQGTGNTDRLTERARKLWRDIMQKKLIAAPALAGLVALPIAGYATFYLMEGSPFNFGAEQEIADAPVERLKEAPVTSAEPLQKPDAELARQLAASEAGKQKAEAESNEVAVLGEAAPASPVAPAPMADAATRLSAPSMPTLMAQP